MSPIPRVDFSSGNRLGDHAVKTRSDHGGNEIPGFDSNHPAGMLRLVLCDRAPSRAAEEERLVICF